MTFGRRNKKDGTTSTKLHHPKAAFFGMYLCVQVLKCSCVHELKHMNT